MYEFIITYFLFLPFYPLAWIESFNRSFVLTTVWLLVSVVTIFFTGKLGFKKFRKIFIAVWVMPGTIVCGAATIAPWPLTLFYVSGKGSCTTVISALVTLLLNFILVFGFSRLIMKLRYNKSHQN